MTSTPDTGAGRIDQDRVERLASWFPGILAVISALLVTYSVRTIAESYVQAVHYDEWNFVRDLAETNGSFPPLRYLFAPHNEHIIATTRILLWVDFKLFNLTHGLIISITVATQFLNAWLFARIVCLGQPVPSIENALALIAAGLTLSLAQWENLLAAFQVGFPIELTGALATAFLVALKASTGALSRVFWWTCLTVAFAVAVFSLGSGPVVPVVGVLALVALKRSRRAVGASALIGMALIGLFLAQTWRPRLDGIVAPRAATDLVHFGACLLGSPFSPDPDVAAPIGMAFLAAWAVTVGVLWRSHSTRRLPPDASMVALMGLALMLLATLAAITWGRAPLGLPGAFSTRYATFTLFLWLCLPGVWLRGLFLSDEARPLARRLVPIPLACIVTAAAWCGLRPDHLINIAAFRAKVETEGYFMASGAIADADASTIAPWLPMVQPALTFLRDRKLNVFSDAWTSRLPSAEQVGRLGIRGAVPPCPEGAIDRTDRLDHDVWAVSGWVTDRNRREAPMVFASDGAGGLLGLTRPLQPRPDVNLARGGAEVIRGFRLPIVRTAGRGAEAMIVALAVPESASCSLSASVMLER